MRIPQRGSKNKKQKIRKFEAEKSVTELKNLIESLNIGFHQAEGRISEHKGKLIEILQ